MGVLNRLVLAEDLETEVRALCERITRNPPLVTWINKRAIRGAMDSTLETTAVLASNASPILATSEDAAEARAALRERREPEFKGPPSRSLSPKRSALRGSPHQHRSVVASSTPPSGTEGTPMVLAAIQPPSTSRVCPVT